MGQQGSVESEVPVFVGPSESLRSAPSELVYPLFEYDRKQTNDFEWLRGKCQSGPDRQIMMGDSYGIVLCEGRIIGGRHMDNRQWTVNEALYDLPYSWRPIVKITHQWWVEHHDLIPRVYDDRQDKFLIEPEDVRRCVDDHKPEASYLEKWFHVEYYWWHFRHCSVLDFSAR